MPTKNVPGVGAAIAVLGLLLFLLATHTMDWIDTDGLSWDLGEFKDVAEAAGSDYFLGAAWYGSWLWVVTFGYLAAVTTLATLVNPVNKGVRAALWSVVLMVPFGLLGLLGLVNLADEQGKVAPRTLGALGMIGGSFPLIFVWLSTVLEDRQGIDFKTGDLGLGFWISWVSLAVVAAGCAVGTRTVTTTAAGPPGIPPAGPMPVGPPPG